MQRNIQFCLINLLEAKLPKFSIYTFGFGCTFCEATTIALEYQLVLLEVSMPMPECGLHAVQNVINRMLNINSYYTQVWLQSPKKWIQKHKQAARRLDQQEGISTRGIAGPQTIYSWNSATL